MKTNAVSSGLREIPADSSLIARLVRRDTSEMPVVVVNASDEVDNKAKAMIRNDAIIAILGLFPTFRLFGSVRI